MSAKILFYSFATKYFINYFTFDAVGERHFHARFQSLDIRIILLTSIR